MTYVFPTDLHLSVTRISATVSLHVEGGALRSSESFSLVLRASRGTNIVLSTGQRLADVDIHFTLSTKWRTAQDVDRDLKSADVGFLAHTEGEQGVPFVHGGALLLNPTVVASFLCAGTHGKMILVLPTVPFEEGTDVPYVWGANRENMLRIDHLQLSALCSEGTESDG